MILEPTILFLSLKTTTATSGLASGRIGWNGGNILNTSNLQSVTSQRSERTLSSRTWRLGLVSARTSHLDVEGRESQFLASDGDILGGKHGSVGGRFITIGLDFHASSYSHHGLSSREICNVDKGVIERSKDVGDTKYFFAFSGDRQVSCAFFTVV